MFGQSLLSGAFGGAACTTDTDQLFPGTAQATTLATYQLNNATTSIPSNTYPGTASNITYAAGEFGNAAVFNGSSSRIGLGTNTFNSLTNLTFSCWVNLNNAPSVYEYLFDGWDYQSGSSRGFGVRINSSGNVQAQSGFSNSTSTNTSSATVSYGNWTHIAVSITQSNTTISINGNTESPQSNNGFDFHTGTTYNLGAFIYTGSFYEYFLDGKLDQVRIFNTALPQSAITALYNETTTTAQSASIDYAGANPNSIAYYKMSDATDQLGNYNGTAYKVNFNTVGKFGFAGKFNGSDSRIALGSASSLVAENFSFSAWIRKTTNNDGFIVGTNINPYYSKVALEGKADGRIRCLYGNYTSSEGNFFSTFNSLNNGQWHHIVYFINQTTAKLYVNGSLDTTHTLTVTPNTGVGLTLGTLYQDNSNSYSTSVLDGEIDQVRIYNSELSAADVTTLYEEIECGDPVSIFTTLNSSDIVGSASLSNFDLTFTSTATPWSMCRSTTGKTSGKWYFEMTVNTVTNNSLGIGIADASASGTSLWGQAAGGIVYYGQTGNIEENTVSSSFSSTFGAGTTLMCAFDMDAGKLWFGKSGVWVGADPSTGNSPASSTIKTYITTAKPFANGYYAGNSVTMNFGVGGFTYTVPTGFSAITV